MSYFIFLKEFNDISGSFYKIAENKSDLDNLNINKSDYKIIEDTQNNFNAVKFGIKIPLKYNNDLIIFEDINSLIKNKLSLQIQIKDKMETIKLFLDNNSNHPLFNQWNNYLNQLNNLNLDLITYPFNKSLEQYFNDLEQPSFSILQLP
jgi:hypothetical protein